MLSTRGDSIAQRRARGVAAVALLLLSLLLAACGASAHTTSATSQQASAATAPGGASSAAASQGSSSPGCGAAGPETLAQAAGRVAVQIYDRELASSEVRSDQRQVEGYAPLLSAVASGNRAGDPGSGHEPRLLAHPRRAPARDAGLARALRRRRPLHHRAGRRQPALPGPHRRALRPVGPGRPRLRQARDALHRTRRSYCTPARRAFPWKALLAPGPVEHPRTRAGHLHGRHYQAFSFTGEAFPSGNAAHIAAALPLPGLAATRAARSIGSTSSSARAAGRASLRLDGAPP